jgi:hypothetical protein
MIKSTKRAVRDTQHVGGRVEVHVGLGWESLSEGDHLEELDLDSRILLKMELQD